MHQHRTRKDSRSITGLEDMKTKLKEQSLVVQQYQFYMIETNYKWMDFEVQRSLDNSIHAPVVGLIEIISV